MGWLVRNGASQQEAKDIAHEAFLADARNLDKFHPGRPFNGWLFAIAHNLWINSISCGKDRPQGQGGTDFLNVMQAVPDPNTEEESAGFRRELLRQALDIVRAEVSPAVWDAFKLVVLDEVAYPEAANRLYATLRSVYMSVYKVRTRLRELVGENEEG